MSFTCLVLYPAGRRRTLGLIFMFDTEIRQLDSDRQSLVYNHHHELIAASDTISAVCFLFLASARKNALKTHFSDENTSRKSRWRSRLASSGVLRNITLDCGSLDRTRKLGVQKYVLVYMKATKQFEIQICRKKNGESANEKNRHEGLLAILSISKPASRETDPHG